MTISAFAGKPIKLYRLMRFSWIPLLIFFIFSCSRKEDNRKWPKITNLGAQLNYNVYGSGDTTLLFVHGWCIDQSYWSDQVDYFEDNYRVVTLDLPGHGHSGKERKIWSVENFSRDIIVIIEALSLTNVVLIGHSMGGDIILEATAKNPAVVVGFVGVDNFKDFGHSPSEEERAEVDLFFQQARVDYKGVMDQFAKGMLFTENTPNEISKRVMRDILHTPNDISIGILESLWTEDNDEKIEYMQELDVKVHLINCDGYPTNEAALEKYCGDSFEVHSIGNLSHYPMIEDPSRFNLILEDILHSL